MIIATCFRFRCPPRGMLRTPPRVPAAWAPDVFSLLCCLLLLVESRRPACPGAGLFSSTPGGPTYPGIARYQGTALQRTPTPTALAAMAATLPWYRSIAGSICFVPAHIRSLASSSSKGTISLEMVAHWHSHHASVRETDPPPAGKGLRPLEAICEGLGGGIATGSKRRPLNAVYTACLEAL